VCNTDTDCLGITDAGVTHCMNNHCQ
jgi:hypothetical protein